MDVANVTMGLEPGTAISAIDRLTIYAVCTQIAQFEVHVLILLANDEKIGT